MDQYNPQQNLSFDQVFASDALAGIKMGAMTCLTGFLESSTPECKDFFWKCLRDYANEHDELTQIMMRKGWYKPYQDPVQMVTQDISKAQQVIGQIPHTQAGHWQSPRHELHRPEWPANPWR